MKILVFSPFSRDANSFWRCMGPMSYLSKHSQGEIDLTLWDQNKPCSWDTVAQFDLVFLHRPCRPDDLTVLRLARNLNIPTWAEYDDWLFHLPEWNPNKSIYHNLDMQQVTAQIMATADVISVTTQALAEKLSTINPNVIIVPNAYRSDLFAYRRQDETPPRKNIYMWRGTNTHDGDLLSVASAFPKLKEKLYFLGMPPYALTSNLEAEKHSIIGMNDNLMYFKYIYHLAPKVLLFPLQDCFFNRCKSNIAYIEALHAGALCVAPDLPEWKKPGVITYEPGNAESFLEAAEAAMELDDKTHQERVHEAFDYMKSLYDISFVNQIRIEILNSIFSPSFKRNNRDPFDQLTPIWAMSTLKGTALPSGITSEHLQQKNLASS